MSLFKDDTLILKDRSAAEARKRNEERKAAAESRLQEHGDVLKPFRPRQRGERRGRRVLVAKLRSGSLLGDVGSEFHAVTTVCERMKKCRR